MGIGPVGIRQVQGELRAARDRAEELAGQLGLEAGDRHRRQLRVEVAVGTAGDVDRAARQGLVHRQLDVGVAGDPGPVAERLIERLPEDDADVFDGVMGPGLEVAIGADGETEAAVAAEQVEHVIEETDPGRRADLAPVEVERDADVGLAGAALDRGLPVPGCRHRCAIPPRRARSCRRPAPSPTRRGSGNPRRGRSRRPSRPGPSLSPRRSRPGRSGAGTYPGRAAR